MKKQLLPLAIVFLSATAVFTSCKKDKDETSVSPAKESCYITSTKNNGTLDSTAITYNTDNKVSKVTYYDKDKNPAGYEMYAYSGNQFIQKVYDETDKLTDEYHHILNADGTIHYTATINTYGNNTEYDTLYYYYQDGYDIMEVENRVNYYNGSQASRESDTTWFTYTDGNKVQQKEKRNNGTVITTAYTYYDLEDKNNIFSGQLIIPGIYGKGNKNLVKSGTSDDSNNNTSAFTYQVNEKGLVTHYVSTYTSNFGTDTFDFNFFYTCK